MAITIRTGDGTHQQIISRGAHAIVSDEPVELGGEDAGLAPFELVMAGLGSCTSMTLQLYARRKGWPLRRLTVSIAGSRQADGFHVQRKIALEGELDNDQRAVLLSIADRCPVFRALTGAVVISTTEGVDADAPTVPAT